MSTKTELQKQIERETGLTVERVESQQQLDAYLSGGLAKLYQQVFAEPPWEEKFSQAEVRDCFRESFEGGGTIFIALDPTRKNKPVAFAISVPLRAAWKDVQEKVQPYVEEKGLDANAVSYFADGGVDPLYRRKGVASRLKKLRMEACSLAGVKTIILRTSGKNYAEINVVNKAGGTVIAGLFEDVSSKRQDGKIAADRRAYYILDGDTKFSGMDVLENVTIVRSRGKDVAIVADAVVPEEQSALAGRIRKIYPGVRQVVFSDGAIFEGKLYVAKKVKPF